MKKTEIYSVRIPEMHRKMIFELKEYFKKNEHLELTTTDIILCAISLLFTEKIK